MKIHFVGTGAGDWDWTRPLNSEIRGTTSTLLDGHVLIDAGITGWENLLRFRIDPARITDLLITHSHCDHFDPENIRKIAAAPGRDRKLRVYASPEAVRLLDTSVLDAVELHRGKEFSLGPVQVKALPANHVLENEMEEAFHFLIETPERKQLLYALDGAWMISYTRRKLGERPLDMIIWDATSGTTRDDWRFADHNDLWMIRSMRAGLAALNLVDDKTVHVFDHIARTLWPESARERAEAAEKFQGILVEDGMTLTL